MKRRNYSQEFKLQAVKLVIEDGHRVKMVAQELESLSSTFVQPRISR